VIKVIFLLSGFQLDWLFGLVGL